MCVGKVFASQLPLLARAGGEALGVGFVSTFAYFWQGVCEDL